MMLSQLGQVGVELCYPLPMTLVGMLADTIGFSFCHSLVIPLLGLCPPISSVFRSL